MNSLPPWSRLVAVFICGISLAAAVTLATPLLASGLAVRPSLIPADSYLADVDAEGDLADLSLTKQASPGTVKIGENITYSITVQNTGPITATAVQVTDTLPAGVSLVSASVPAGVSCSDQVICSLGDINPGESLTITLVVETLASGTITNTASVVSETEDPVPGNNSDTTSTTVTPLADLSITKIATPNQVFRDQDVIYTLTVTNNGPSTAQAVQVMDSLLGGLSFVDSTASQGEGCSGEDTISCNLGNLSPSGSAIVTIQATTQADGPISNTASTSAVTEDPLPANNSSTSIITVTAEADLNITKQASPGTVKIGENITYSLTVENFGPSTATAVQVVDTLSSDVSLVSVGSSGISCSATSPVTCTKDGMLAGEIASVTIVVKAEADGLISNTASVDSDTDDPDTSDNSDDTSTTVTPLADLALTKTPNSTSVNVGENIAYSIEVTNNGPSAAQNVQVTDNLPSNVSLVPGTLTPDSCSGTTTVTCNFGALPPLGKHTINMVVKTLIEGLVSNTATVSSSTPDLVTNNDSSTANTTVNPSADLRVSKSDDPDPVVGGGLLSYMLSVTNKGPSTAEGVVLTDTLPAEVTLVGILPEETSCTQDGVALHCDLGDMSMNATVQVQIDVRVAPGFTGALINKAGVSSATTFDPQLGDNSATLDTLVVEGIPPTPPNWVLPVGNGERYDVFELGFASGMVELEVDATGVITAEGIEIDYVRFYRWDAVGEKFVEIALDQEFPYNASLAISSLNYGWNEVRVRVYDTAMHASDFRHIWLFRLFPTYLALVGR